MSTEHWERIDKHQTTFTTPEMMWQMAKEYFTWNKANPIKIPKVLSSGKESGKEIIITKIRPLSIQAFCFGCGILPEYLKDITKTKATESNYYKVTVAIINIIRTQNIEMAMIDEFNPIFTAKILGLEKEEVPTGGVTITHVYQKGDMKLSNSENELLEKVREEKSKKENSIEQSEFIDADELPLQSTEE